MAKNKIHPGGHFVRFAQSMRKNIKKHRKQKKTQFRRLVDSPLGATRGLQNHSIRLEDDTASLSSRWVTPYAERSGVRG